MGESAIAFSVVLAGSVIRRCFLGGIEATWATELSEKTALSIARRLRYSLWMESLVSDARQKVCLWAAAHRDVLLYDEESGTLLDVASGKRLHVPWRTLTAFEEKRHPETQEPYFVLQFEGGKQIALVDPGGVAFAPSTQNSGPVPNLPAVMCLRDFLTLKQRVDHYLYDHPDEPPPRESLDLIMICIAILDGARAVGFDVGDLEGELEKALNEVERRTS